jgi:hypothetical protein
MLPRLVFCPLDHAYRDLEEARRVVQGEFVHGGIRRRLGVPPDWRSPDLPADQEWGIEWRKFYYGLDLAHAFAATGERRFLDTWVTLVTSFVHADAGADDSSDVRARRLQNWIYAWRRFADAPGFPGLAAGTEALLLESLATTARRIRANLTPERNHRTLELYALLVVALALPTLDADGALARFALAELTVNLLTDVLPDGVHREGSTHYHMTTLRSFLGARENARRFGLTLPAAYDERLARACDFALHAHSPLGTIAALSDADAGSYLDLLVLAGRLFGRADWLWAGTGGRDGTPPAERCGSFPLGGYFFQRSHWAPDAECARYLIFDCGPLGDGGHGHYDALHVEVVANGRALLADPGRYTYHEETPNWRRWFKGTAAHNTVCVDGLDQTPYRRGKPRGPAAVARLLFRRTTPSLDVLCGEVRSPVYETVHTRLILFVAGEYWIVVDRVVGDRPHRFDLRYHLTSQADGHTGVWPTELGWRVESPGLALETVGPHTPIIEAGWVAPCYGIRHPAPVVSVATDAVAATTFVTLIAPHPDATVAPRLDAWQGDAFTRSLLAAVEGPLGAWRDEVALSAITSGGNGPAGWWRRRAHDGSVLAADGDVARPVDAAVAAGPGA